MAIKTHLYQEIAESLRRRIASGQLAAGDRLPSVRELAQQWGCTPGTVNRAYGLLARDGLITSHRGSGTHVAPSPLQPEDPAWQWASLINQAERYLLESISSGHTSAEAEAALAVAVARWQTLQSNTEQAETAVSASDIRFAGSHDLAVEWLTRILAEGETAVDLHVDYVGSLGGLMALARGEADIAGVHLWDEATDSYNAPFVQRLLPGRRVMLCQLVRRSMGLILPPGNPRDIKTVADLAQPDLSLANRQAGSGTRVWLDAQLHRHQIEPAAIAGYEQESATHLAVAQAVAEEKADVGLGIHAAAAAYDLAFVPLTWEQYDLVIPAEQASLPTVQNLMHVLQSDRFRAAASALGGYDTTRSGREIWL